MAQEKDERTGTGTRRSNEAGEDPARRAAAHGRTGSREGERAGAESRGAAAGRGRRRERFLIGPRLGPAGQPFAYPQHSMDEVAEYLSQQDDVEIVRRLKLGGTLPFSAHGRSANEVLVAKIEEGKAQRLRAAAPASLVIERDGLLTRAHTQSLTACAAPIGALLPLRPTASEVTIRVVGERDQPIAGATVVIDVGGLPAGLPAQALTDESGTARLTFFGSSIDSIQTVFIRPAADYWDRLISAPRLGSGVNTIRVRSLGEFHPNFPAQRLSGWGHRLMRIDPTTGRFSGSGVRIGIIDSGCDTSHALLRHVTQGQDFTAGATETSWTQDPLAHGTHCAGIINAANTEQGIAGCAPDAELHVFKVIPEGRVSDLLAALDECIVRELDVVHIGVVCEEFSELVSQKLYEARHKGIACIAAAGNTGAAPAFPATLPGVMAVGAVGRLKEFPADSSHTLSVLPHLIGTDEVFAASFSAAGPQVAVSAPGVAVISTMPGGGYAAADGTSVAAAYVTGLAALVLAHHPLLQQGLLRARNAQRVQALIELIRASAVPHFADPLRGGAGVPDLLRIPAGPGFAMGVRADGIGAEVRGSAGGYAPAYGAPPPQGWPGWTPAQGSRVF
jgi:subtilisin